jgi:carbonic anhydrase/acetyltransferase-like protein (isoleucine patch superfamily)
LSAALVLAWRGVLPRIDATAWIAPNATIVGDVDIGAGASLWFQTVVRGDVNRIVIGAGSNLQDGSVVHVSRNFPTTIGAGVLIGHMAMIHGCDIGDGAFVGMKACVMDGTVIEPGGMLAAGALLTPGKRVAGGDLWAGAPARRVRAIGDTERATLREAPERYARLAAEYKAAEAT